MEVIPIGGELKAIIMTVKPKIRLSVVDSTSHLWEVQYAVISEGQVNMTYDAGSSPLEWMIAGDA